MPNSFTVPEDENRSQRFLREHGFTDDNFIKLTDKELELQRQYFSSEQPKPTQSAISGYEQPTGTPLPAPITTLPEETEIPGISAAQEGQDNFQQGIQSGQINEETLGIPFDPEGTGYDQETAEKAGLKPDETGHWPSREPKTGQILKGQKHETYSKTVEGEKAAGYEIKKGEDGKYYSQLVSQEPTSFPIPQEEGKEPKSISVQPIESPLEAMQGEALYGIYGYRMAFDAYAEAVKLLKSNQKTAAEPYLRTVLLANLTMERHRINKLLGDEDYVRHTYYNGSTDELTEKALAEHMLKHKAGYYLQEDNEAIEQYINYNLPILKQQVEEQIQKPLVYSGIALTDFFADIFTNTALLEQNAPTTPGTDIIGYAAGPILGLKTLSAAAKYIPYLRYSDNFIIKGLQSVTNLSYVFTGASGIAQGVVTDPFFTEKIKNASTTNEVNWWKFAQFATNFVGLGIAESTAEYAVRKGIDNFILNPALQNLRIKNLWSAQIAKDYLDELMYLDPSSPVAQQRVFEIVNWLDAIEPNMSREAKQAYAKTKAGLTYMLKDTDSRTEYLLKAGLQPYSNPKDLIQQVDESVQQYLQVLKGPKNIAFNADVAILTEDILKNIQKIRTELKVLNVESWPKGTVEFPEQYNQILLKHFEANNINLPDDFPSGLFSTLLSYTEIPPDSVLTSMVKKYATQYFEGYYTKLATQGSRDFIAANIGLDPITNRTVAELIGTRKQFLYRQAEMYIANKEDPTIGILGTIDARVKSFMDRWDLSLGMPKDAEFATMAYEDVQRELFNESLVDTPMGLNRAGKLVYGPEARNLSLAGKTVVPSKDTVNFIKQQDLLTKDSRVPLPFSGKVIPYDIYGPIAQKALIYGQERRKTALFIPKKIHIEPESFTPQALNSVATTKNAIRYLINNAQKQKDLITMTDTEIESLTSVLHLTDLKDVPIIVSNYQGILLNKLEQLPIQDRQTITDTIFGLTNNLADLVPLPSAVNAVDPLKDQNLLISLAKDPRTPSNVADAINVISANKPTSIVINRDNNISYWDLPSADKERLLKVYSNLNAIKTKEVNVTSLQENLSDYIEELILANRPSHEVDQFLRIQQLIRDPELAIPEKVKLPEDMARLSSQAANTNIENLIDSIEVSLPDNLRAPFKEWASKYTYDPSSTSYAQAKMLLTSAIHKARTAGQEEYAKDLVNLRRSIINIEFAPESKTVTPDVRLKNETIENSKNLVRTYINDISEHRVAMGAKPPLQITVPIKKDWESLNKNATFQRFMHVRKIDTATLDVQDIATTIKLFLNQYSLPGHTLKPEVEEQAKTLLLSIERHINQYNQPSYERHILSKDELLKQQVQQSSSYKRSQESIALSLKQLESTLSPEAYNLAKQYITNTFEDINLPKTRESYNTKLLKASEKLSSYNLAKLEGIPDINRLVEDYLLRSNDKAIQAELEGLPINTLPEYAANYKGIALKATEAQKTFLMRELLKDPSEWSAYATVLINKVQQSLTGEDLNKFNKLLQSIQNISPEARATYGVQKPRSTTTTYSVNLEDQQEAMKALQAANSGLDPDLAAKIIQVESKQETYPEVERLLRTANARKNHILETIANKFGIKYKSVEELYDNTQIKGLIRAIKLIDRDKLNFQGTYLERGADIMRTGLEDIVNGTNNLADKTIFSYDVYKYRFNTAILDHVQATILQSEIKDPDELKRTAQNMFKQLADDAGISIDPSALDDIIVLPDTLEIVLPETMQDIFGFDFNVRTTPDLPLDAPQFTIENAQVSADYALLANRTIKIMQAYGGTSDTLPTQVPAFMYQPLTPTSWRNNILSQHFPSLNSKVPEVPDVLDLKKHLQIPTVNTELTAGEAKAYLTFYKDLEQGLQKSFDNFLLKADRKIIMRYNKDLQFSFTEALDDNSPIIDIIAIRKQILSLQALRETAQFGRINTQTLKGLRDYGVNAFSMTSLIESMQKIATRDFLSNPELNRTMAIERDYLLPILRESKGVTNSMLLRKSRMKFIDAYLKNFLFPELRGRRLHAGADHDFSAATLKPQVETNLGEENGL